MEQKMFIKRVIRANLPETNSSSSHSVVICRDPKYLMKKEDSNFNLKLRDDGILYIPSRPEDFGWQWEKFNDPLNKLWYVCGILFNRGINKKIKVLNEILKKFTGAKDVVYEWMEKRNEKDYSSTNECPPSIDHQSHEIFPEILESKESIINFIFNSRSWLFLGNDNDSSPEGFYEESGEPKKPDAIASIYYPGDIGRVDIEISHFPNNFLGNNNDIYNLLHDNDNTIDSIYYDKDKKKFILNNSIFCYFPGKNNFLYSRNSSIIGIVDSNIYYMSDDLFDKVSEVMRKKYNHSSTILSQIPKEVQDILDLPEYKEDLITVPVIIRSKEFGGL